jgi:hypothetical protein
MMTGINIISPIDRIGASQNTDAVSSYRNDTASLFQLKAAGDRFAQILGINQNDTPLARGTLREAITQYAAQNNIDPDQVEIISKVFSNNLDIQAGKEIIQGNANTLPSLSDAARSTAFERNPSKVESFSDISKPNIKAENASVGLQRDGESAARNAVGLISAFREMPYSNSLPTATQQPQTANYTNSILKNALSTLEMLSKFVNSLGRGSTASSTAADGAKSSNSVGTLQNARNVVGDIRSILGTDAEIATTGKKNAALAKLDSAIDAWAKENNIPAGVVSLVKAEVAREVGTYNGKLITADDEANKLALQKFPVQNMLFFGDVNANNRAAYAKEVKAELQSQNSSVLKELNSVQSNNRTSSQFQHTMLDAYGNTSSGPNYSTGTSPLNRTLNAANNLASILGTSSEIAASGKKTEPLAKLNAAIDAWGKANNIPATTIALAKSRIATEYGTSDGKLPTIDDEAKRVALERFPPATGFAAFFGDPNNKARSDFESNYKKDVSQQVQAAIEELDILDFNDGFGIDEKNKTPESPVNQNKIDDLINPEASNTIA